MKARTLRFLAGATVPLILSGAVQGGFLGLTTSVEPNIFGIRTVEVYASFDRPGSDRFIGAAGISEHPMDIHVVGGTFFQSMWGSDTAPNSAFFQTFPTLAYDTFVTIGQKATGPPPGGQGNMILTLSPGWPGFGPSSLEGTGLSWVVSPAAPNSDPFNPDYVAGNGSVLIGQFSTLDGTAISGMMRILVVSNNVSTELDVSFFQSLPCEGGECDDGEPCNGQEVCKEVCVTLAFPDCNSNGVLDSCEIPGAGDCNGNGVPDDCDPDNDNDGIPDDCECIWDLDGNAIVGVTDMLVLLGFWGPCAKVCLGDLDASGSVGVVDFLELLAHWGECP